MKTPKNPERRVTELQDGIVYKARTSESTILRNWSYGINRDGALQFTSGGIFPADWISKDRYWIESTDEDYSTFAQRVADGHSRAQAAYDWCAANGFPD
jgi:hypothetical protein